MKSNKDLLIQYAGFATQLVVSLGITVFGGQWLDKHFLGSSPILVWVLPMFVIMALIIKVIKDTSK